MKLIILNNTRLVPWWSVVEGRKFMEWILRISILVNFLLAIGCIYLARERNWYRKSWYELANRLVQSRKRGAETWNYQQED